MSNRLDERFVLFDPYKDLISFGTIARLYLSVNQSFLQMYYDDFMTSDKTDPVYIDKVNTSMFRMTPGNGGSWYSKMWTASSSITACKMIWRQSSDFDHDIEISSNNGTNWTVISSGGSLSNLDKEVIITNPGTQMILRVLNGATGYLLDYVLLVK